MKLISITFFFLNFTILAGDFNFNHRKARIGQAKYFIYLFVFHTSLIYFLTFVEGCSASYEIKNHA